MAELDELLRASITRIAQTTTPERDSAGVADAIHARVAAGDTGAAAPSSGPAPGWGGGPGGWIPWIATVAVAVLVGGAIGVSGLVAHPVEVHRLVTATSVLTDHAPALSCPGGPAVSALAADTRVLAVARSDDDAFLAVRDPGGVPALLWLPASTVVADDPAALAELPIGTACPVVAVEQQEVAPTESAAPTPGPEPAPGPQPPRPVTPPADTTPPSITAISASPTLIYNASPTTISVTASDDVAVAGVQLSWTGGVSGSAAMAAAGGGWTYTFGGGSASPADLTFTARAVDAAGNLSAPAQVLVDWQYFG